jgi:CheY-like chemotaxis protein
MLHILLVEDNSADVLLIRESLRTSSIAADVTIAYDGEEALRLLSQPDFRPAFILLDLNIPRFDGFTILEQHRTADVPPVVVFTGSENPADRERAFELGARDYVTKPMGKRPFIEAIHLILERWGGHEQLSSNAADSLSG